MTLAFAGVVRAELGRTWSLRTPFVLLSLLAAVPIVLALVRATVAASAADDVVGALALGEAVGLAAVPAGLVAAAFGVWVGAIDQVDDAFVGTYVAVPRRRWVVGARLLTAVGAVLACATAAAALALAASWVVVDAAGAPVRGVEDVVAVALASVAGQVLLAALGVAIAVLARTRAASATVAALLLVVAPTLLGITGRAALQPVTQLLPTPAMQGATRMAGTAPFPVQGALPSTLEPTWSLAVLALWSALSVAAALVLVQRRSPFAASGEVHGGRRRGAGRTSAVRASAAGLWRAEVAKTWSLPAVRLLLLVSAALVVGVPALSAAGTDLQQVFDGPPTPGDVAGASPSLLAGIVGGGLGVAQVPLAIVGAMLMTSELATRSWDATLLATPHPRRVLAAKLLAVVAIVAPVVALAAVLVAALAMPIAASAGLSLASAPAVLAATVPRMVFVAVAVALVGVALGSLVRSAFASVAVVASLLVVAPTVLGQLQVLAQGTPLVVVGNVGRLLPTATAAMAEPIPAGAEMPLVLRGGILQLDPDASLVVLLAWTVALVAVALVARRPRTPER